MTLLGRNEDHHARTDRLNALRRLDLRMAFDDEVEVLADLVVMQWRCGALRVRHHAGQHVVDLGEFLVHKECTHAPATRALELRQLILMEDVSHSPTPKPQSPIPNLIPPRRRLACGPLTSGIKSRHYMRLARFRNSSDSVDIA